MRVSIGGRGVASTGEHGVALRAESPPAVDSFACKKGPRPSASVQGEGFLGRLARLVSPTQRAVWGAILGASMLGLAPGASLADAATAESTPPPQEVATEVQKAEARARVTPSPGHRAWFGTDWFFAPRAEGEDPTHNLWATNGPLDKVDHLLQKRTGAQGLARAFEEQNFRVVDDRKYSGNWLHDGRQIPGSEDPTWWGNCHDAARAGLLFEAPKHAVTRDGVTFTVRDLEGLLTLAVADADPGFEFVGDRYNAWEDRVRLLDGSTIEGELLDVLSAGLSIAPSPDSPVRGDFRTLSRADLSSVPWPIAIRTPAGKRYIEPSTIESVTAQYTEDLRPWVARDKILEWAQTGGGVADVDDLERVFNRPFSSAKVETFTARPAWAVTASAHEPDSRADASLRREWGELKVEFGDKTRLYRYWIAFGPDGSPADGGWYNGLHGADRHPDYLWRPREQGFEWPKELRRNPFVPVQLVRELYEASLE